MELVRHDNSARRAMHRAPRAPAGGTINPTMRAAERSRHERWLLELTAIPTAAGREHRVIRWVRQWVMARPDLRLRKDAAGNLLIARRAPASTRASRRPPLLITAHMDHPAFVVVGLGSDGTVELEFRGGVHDPYFARAVIDIFDHRDRAHRATIVALDAQARPFKRVIARLAEATDQIMLGDVGRWAFPGQSLPRIARGVLHTHACDDLAAVAGALAALDHLRGRRGVDHVAVLLTRAEEVGFIGAIAACKQDRIAKAARLICLENSRSFADSPIGAGPIVRVGDKLSVFEPALTNRISALMTQHAASQPAFKWQRKLMPGGTCEATAFNAYGYHSTCLCLPLGNYHNMTRIDEVSNGRRPARVGPEFISMTDYHGLIDMLVLCALELDAANAPALLERMEQLFADHKDVLVDESR